MMWPVFLKSSKAESTSKILIKGRVIDLIFKNILMYKSPKLFIPLFSKA